MPGPSPSPGPLRFGAFEVDVHAGELRKHGIRIRLQDQPFRVLQVLLEHPGEVITREELQRQIWPADTFVDFDRGLNNAVKRLREALADSADEPRYIETLPKRGYRFVASLESARSEEHKLRGPIDSILVFPLEVQSTDPDTDCLAVGIPGSVIHRLSQIPGLRVISWRNTSREESDPLAIGRRLGVKTVLIGRLWQRLTKLRLHVDLLDTASGEEIWGDQYDRDLPELFAVQDDISREVSLKLRLKMTGEAESRFDKRYTESIEAYQLYIRARRWCERRSAEGFRRGIEYLTHAIQIDPNYALAHAELAQCISVPCYYGAADPNVAYPRAKACALRALEIDPNIAEGHAVLATILKNYEWDWKSAEREYKRAIELNPNYASAHYHYSYFLVESCRFDEAILEATEALVRDPMSGLLNAGLAWVLLNSRMIERSIEQALTAVEVDPNMTLCYWTLGTAYEQIGKYEAAIEAYEKGIALGGALAHSIAFTARVRAKMGEKEKAWDAIRELERLSKTQFIPLLALAAVYDGLEERNHAIVALERAYKNRETNLVQMKTLHQFDTIRDDPRFQDLERRIGLRS